MQPRDYFPPPNVVRLLEEEGATTLLSLLEQANLIEELEKPSGKFTVFAPTNKALSALDEDIVDAITQDQGLLEEVMR